MFAYRIVGRAMFAALVAAGAVSAATADAPLYAQVRATQKATIYFKFQGNEMRMAASVAALATAKPIQGQAIKGMESHGMSGATFPATELPVPGADNNPVKVAFQLIMQKADPAKSIPAGQTAVALFSFMRKDAQGAQWTATLRSEKPLAAAAAAYSTLFDISAPMSPSLTLAAIGGHTGMRIGVIPASGADTLAEVTYAGKPAELVVRVTDSNWKEVRVEQGPPARYAPAPSGPTYAIEVAKKGQYNVEASFDVGPFGGILKSASSVRVQ